RCTGIPTAARSPARAHGTEGQVMRRFALLLLVTAGFVTPALADDPWPHFVRSGDGLVCEAQAGKPAADNMPCLKIGAMAVGTKRSTAEFRLGKPVQTIKVDEQIFYAYPLVFSNEGQG